MLNLLSLWVALSPASASPRFAGVVMDDFADELAPLRFDSSSTGWTADFKGGVLRVFIGPDEKSAQWWVSAMADIAKKQKPQPPDPPLDLPADDALAGGTNLLILRFGNMGVMIESAGGALVFAERVAAALRPEPGPWPQPPTIAEQAGLWHVDVAFEPAHITYVGASPLPGEPLRFAAPPSAVVAWDEWGRALRQDFDAAGNPVPRPPPWADYVPPPPPDVSDPPHD